MRMEWSLESFSLDKNEFPVKFLPLAKKFEFKWHLAYPDARERVANLRFPLPALSRRPCSIAIRSVNFRATVP